MAVDPETRQHLLELAYDALPDDESAELRRRVDSQAELTQAYAEARAAADLLAAAARLDEPKLPLKRPASNVLTPQPKAAAAVRGPFASRAAIPAYPLWGRETTWIVGVAAAILLVISLGGYVYHRGHLADIAADHLRLRVVGPSQLYHGVSNRYAITTTSVTGRPVSALVELTLRSARGEQLIAHKQETDPKDGRLEIALPADLTLADAARLEIHAAYEGKEEQIGANLAVNAVRYATHLFLDKARYRPGEIVRYRSVTLSRFGLDADREARVRFEVVDSRGSVLPGSILEGTTRHGVGCGEFRIPEAASDGRYALVAISPRGEFPEQRRTFLVAGAQAATASAGPSSPEPTHFDVRFFPEGGELVAGLENRVYFTSRDSLGKPVALRGMVYDSGGQPVASVETASEGRGTFSIEPRWGERYRLRVLQPEGLKEEYKLPVVSDGEVLLTAGVGVFPAGRPIPFNVRATKPGIPLVASAWCRGAEVGQQAMVTDGQSNPVEISLDDQVAGVVRLTLYDYRTSPPKPVAERLVYRLPARRLRVDLGETAATATVGRGVRLPVRVWDEKSQPAAAVLGVVVANGTSSNWPGGTSLPAYFLLAGTIDRPEELDQADVLLDDDPKSAAALDLFLGTQGWRRFVEKPSEESVRDNVDAAPGPLLAATSPPAVFDNLSDLEQRYRESLEAYRANRTRPQNALTMLSLFGGLGLILFVTMLAILNIPTGLRLWVPSVSAALVCLVIGAVLMNPERLQSSLAGAVAFAPFQPVPASPDAPQSPAAATAREKQAEATERARNAVADEVEEIAERDAKAGPEMKAASAAAAPPAAEPPAAPNDAFMGKAAGLRRMPAKPSAAPAEAEPRRSMSEGQLAMPAKAAKAKGGSHPSTFVVRQYSYRSSPAAAEDRAGNPEILYWHPLLLTGADGRATIEFDLPDTADSFGVIVNAHAASGRIGFSQREIKPGR